MSTAQFGILIPIFIFLGAFALVFGLRYLQNKERMAMIERGMDPSSDLPKKRQSNPAFVLTFGLLLIGAGLGLFIAYVMDIFVFYDHRNSNPALYFSMLSFFGGSGLFLAYRIEKKDNQKKEL